jgi:effector-binding domain-containing protein
MITDLRLEDRSQQHYAAIRIKAPIPYGDLLPPLYGEVVQWLANKGLAPSGAPMVRYLTTDMSRELDIEVGWLIAAAVASDERVTVGLVPAGKYVVGMYTGPYNGLVEATAALLDWGEQNHVTWKKSTHGGIEWWNTRLEIYLTDPNTEPDPTKWQTELAILTADQPVD